MVKYGVEKARTASIVSDEIGKGGMPAYFSQYLPQGLVGISKLHLVSDTWVNPLEIYVDYGLQWGWLPCINIRDRIARQSRDIIRALKEEEKVNAGVHYHDYSLGSLGRAIYFINIIQEYRKDNS